MKGKYKLTDRKLSDEEFKAKYYVDGYDQQYHTRDISDGVDERQQLLINNDRWLFDDYKYAIDFYNKTAEERISQIQEINKKIIRNNIITAMCVVASAIINIILLITLWI